MNTKKLSLEILDILDEYNFITEYPFDHEELREKIEEQIKVHISQKESSD